MIKIEKILSSDEFRSLLRKAVHRSTTLNGHLSDFTPGMAWYQDWIFDPSGERETQKKYVEIPQNKKGRSSLLSDHYWEYHSDRRPPICIVLPSGEYWNIDGRDQYGKEWRVLSDKENKANLTVSPQIVTANYQGRLIRGRFSSDFKGRKYTRET